MQISGDDIKIYGKIDRIDIQENKWFANILQRETQIIGVQTDNEKGKFYII